LLQALADSLDQDTLMSTSKCDWRDLSETTTKMKMYQTGNQIAWVLYKEEAKTKNPAMSVAASGLIEIRPNLGGN